MPATPRILVCPADLGRCGHRLIWPARALAAQGADIVVELPAETPEEADRSTGIRGVWMGDGAAARLVGVARPDADVVVLQRPLRRGLVDAIPMLQAHGVRVIVEVDDDFATISRRNISWKACHPALHPDRNWQHLAEACRRADLVTVTTPALARRYAAHGRVRVIPNHVPASYLEVVTEPHEGVVVGWSGSVTTHPDDLQVTRGSVARAVRATGATFSVVGPGTKVQRNLGLHDPPKACGWVSLDNYPLAMAQLDVGVVPLELSAFNEAKSSLKGTEFAALGVPFVASPTGPYSALPSGVGLLAAKPKEWEAKVRRLATDAQARADLAGTGRTWAATQTVEANCGQWADAWMSVVNTVCAR